MSDEGALRIGHPAGDYSGLPGVHVTLNQICAYNMARWRKAAGMTQAELGSEVGLSFRAVSAAERTWDRTDGKGRVFDAGLIVALAIALDVPVAAMFWPPADDGISKRYLFHPHEHGAACLDMANLFSLLFPDSTGDSGAEAEWQAALVAAVNRYMDPERGADLIAYLEDMTSAERRAERLQRIRWQRDALAALVGDLDQMVDAITDTANRRSS